MGDSGLPFFICIASCFFFLAERCRQPLATRRERLLLSERDTPLLHFVLELAEPTDREESRKLHLTVQDSTEKNEQPNADYQLVPKSRSTVSRDYAIPQIQNSIDAVADTIVNAADEVVEGLGDLITPSTQGNDLTEAAWQRKLRYQANRKKKRGRGI